MPYSLLLGWSAITLLGLTPPVLAQNSTTVADLAKNVTVAIRLQQQDTVGSGAIVARQGNIYTLVTNRHVVCGNSFCRRLPQNETYTIRLPDGQTQRVNSGAIKFLGPDLDLAIMQFPSDRSYALAPLAPIDSLKVDDALYTAGYPFAEPGFKFGRGYAVAAVNRRLTGDRGGYTVIYNADTLPGMSGGGVFNSRGQLVAIHGQGDRYREQTNLVDDSRTGATITPLEVGSKVGYNRGIPIRWVWQGLSSLGLAPSNNIPPSDPASNAQTADEYFIAGFNQWIEPGDDPQEGKRAALKQFERAIDLNPRYTVAHFMRGYIHIELQSYRAALADFDRVIALSPTIAGAYANRGILKAEKLNEDLPGALADYNKAIELDPQLAIVYNNRGILKYSHYKDPQGALADYNRTITLTPRFAAAYNNRGLLKEEQLNDPQGALADYSRAIALDNRFALAYNNRGSLQETKFKNYPAALADYDQAIALRPQYLSAYINRGYLKRQKLQDLAGAMADFERAIAIDPRSARAYVSRGAAQEDQKNWNGALADYTQAIAVNPKYAAAHSSRAKLYADRLNNPRAALADFNRAIELEPKSPTLYSLRGNLKYQGLKDPPGAVADFSQAIAVDPNFGHAYILRAYIRYRELGDRAGGIADLRQAIAIGRRQGQADVADLALRMLQSWGVSE